MEKITHYEKTLTSEVLFEGRVITLTKDTALLENGKTATREVVHHHGGACILPYFEDGTICMVRQFRYAMQQELWELPAGKLEKGEDPFEAAKRELGEECGLTADHYISLGQFYPTVGYDTEVIYTWVATGLHKTQMHLGLVQAGGDPCIDDLGIVAHGGVELAQRDVMVGGQTALLAQLPLGGFKGVLALFQLAGGQLPQLLLHGVAELAHHADGAVLKIGQDARTAVVMHHLTGGGLAVFQQSSVLGQGDDPALKEDLAGKRLFVMCDLFHCIYPLCPAQRRFSALSLRQSTVCCQ